MASSLLYSSHLCQRRVRLLGLRKSLHIPIPDRSYNPLYPIAFKKLSVLIFFLRFSLIAFVNPSLACPASFAPSNVPSPPGKSTVCSYNGIFGASDSGFCSARFLSALAARCRCFFDFAIKTVSPLPVQMPECTCTYRTNPPPPPCPAPH